MGKEMRRGGRGRASGGRSGGRGGGGGGRQAVGGGGGGGGGGKQNKALSGAVEAALALTFEKHNVFDGDMLKVCGLALAPELSSLKSSIDFNAPNFCNALGNVIARRFSGCSFIDFSENNITNPGVMLKALRDKGLHQGIRGFSFANNRIKDAAGFFPLSSFKNLYEIVCSGNPVTNNAEAARQIIKKVPWLGMLDGNVIEQAPLHLPWPEPVEQNDQSIEVLTFVQGFLQNLAGNGPEASSVNYHQNATFSLSLVGAPPLVGKNIPAKTALQELQQLRQNQEKHSHDLKTHAKQRISNGRSEVAQHMQSMLYRRNLMCEHGLNDQAQVIFMQEGAPTSMALVTVHGVITWRHPDAQDSPVSNAFDRTFTLVPSEGAGPGAFLICNDMVSLRPLEQGNTSSSNVLWTPSNRVYLQSMVDNNGACNAIEKVEAIAKQCKSETQFVDAKNEVNMAGDGVLNDAFQASQGDPDLAIKIARVVGRTQTGVQNAVSALNNNKGDLDAASVACSSNNNASSQPQQQQNQQAPPTQS